jgi:hypothetical protein
MRNVAASRICQLCLVFHLEALLCSLDEAGDFGAFGCSALLLLIVAQLRASHRMEDVVHPLCISVSIGIMDAFLCLLPEPAAVLSTSRSGLVLRHLDARAGLDVRNTVVGGDAATIKTSPLRAWRSSRLEDFKVADERLDEF